MPILTLELRPTSENQYQLVAAQVNYIGHISNDIVIFMSVTTGNLAFKIILLIQARIENRALLMLFCTVCKGWREENVIT